MSGNNSYIITLIKSISRNITVFNLNIDGEPGMGGVSGRHKNHICQAHDSDNTFTFGNTKTYSVHNNKSFEMN